MVELARALLKPVTVIGVNRRASTSSMARRLEPGELQRGEGKSRWSLRQHDRAARAGRRGHVRIAWTDAGGTATLTVEDDEPDLSLTANPFVPFFTTKPTGSGIGLVLGRQIAEAHRGTLTLRNRKGARGAEAIVTLLARAVA